MYLYWCLYYASAEWSMLAVLMRFQTGTYFDNCYSYDVGFLNVTMKVTFLAERVEKPEGDILYRLH